MMKFIFSSFSEFYNVLFMGLRVMIEGESVINGYFGPEGFG